MIRPRYSLLILALFLGSTLILTVNSPTSTDFIIYTDGLGLQVGYTRTGRNDWILISCSSGLINSSTNSLSMSNSGGGYLSFLNNETVSFTITFSDIQVTVEGDEGNDMRRVTNSSSITGDVGNTVVIKWMQIVQPFLPYMFILGMIGLVSMFGGPILAIKMMKENPRWALTQGIMFTVLGMGLFMAWLSS